MRSGLGFPATQNRTCRSHGIHNRPVGLLAALQGCGAPLCRPRGSGAAAAAAAAIAVRPPPACDPSPRWRCHSLPASAPPASISDTAAALPLLLDDVRVVLVAPKTPSNIGAAARALANFETLHLWIVAPRCDPREGEAYKIACGLRVLDNMTVVDTLAEALADTTSSIGFTRRAGSTRLTHASIGAMLRDFPDAVPGMAAPRWDAVANADGDNGSGKEMEQSSAEQSTGGNGRQQQALQEAEQEQEQQRRQERVWTSISEQGTTALVFGREESGLTEEELRLCTHACAIPTGRVQPSMNLSHAVGVVLAALFERRLAALGLEELPVGQDVQGNPKVQAGLQPASASELEALLAKIAAVARAVGVNDQDSHGGGNQGRHGRRRLPLGHIRALMSRAKANTWEVRSLHGLATATLKALGVDKEDGV